jgi:hypothetical protein
MCSGRSLDRPPEQRRAHKFDPQPMEEIKSYIDLVSEQWDQSLSRLKAFVER